MVKGILPLAVSQWKAALAHATPREEIKKWAPKLSCVPGPISSFPEFIHSFIQVLGHLFMLSFVMGDVTDPHWDFQFSFSQAHTPATCLALDNNM